MNKDRFKFRIWDEKYKNYFREDIEICCDGTILCSPSDGLVIEQCTGLKDKNGRLIYEGDLLGFSKDDEVFTEICWCDTLASFMCDDFPETSGNLETCHANELAQLEIVGNIHEEQSK